MEPSRHDRCELGQEESHRAHLAKISVGGLGGGEQADLCRRRELAVGSGHHPRFVPRGQAVRADPDGVRVLGHPRHVQSLNRGLGSSQARASRTGAQRAEQN